MPPRLPAPVGERFGRLVVLGDAESRDARAYWLVRCDCGNKKETLAGNIRRGLSRSCGCRKGGFTHGLTTEGAEHPLYRTWHTMRERCRNPKRTGYGYYGGRGIKVCERWNDFGAFVEDMGERLTPQHSIDRIDPDGDYEPGNCRWATKREQSLNQRPRKAA